MSAYRKRLMSIIANQEQTESGNPIAVIRGIMIDHVSNLFRYNAKADTYVFTVTSGNTYEVTKHNATNSLARNGTLPFLLSNYNDAMANQVPMNQYANPNTATSFTKTITGDNKYLYVSVNNDAETVTIKQL